MPKVRSIPFPGHVPNNDADFVKVNLLPLLISLLMDPLPSIRTMACWILGTMVQNNTSVKRAVVSFAFIHEC
jgi:hypothetical protein